MSNATIVEWLNENELRGYPLLEESTNYYTHQNVTYELHRLIVDALLLYDLSPDMVEITSIQTSSGTLTINITNQPAFTLANYSSITEPQYLRNSFNSLIVVSAYASQLPNNAAFNVSGAVFEPCTVLEIPLSIKGLSSLTVAGNTGTGDITLTEGYQLSLIPTANSLEIEVGRNFGIPLPCISVSNITNDCTSIISSINGASPLQSGSPIKFIAGNHVKIFEDQANNRIYIGLDFESTDIPIQQLPTPPVII